MLLPLLIGQLHAAEPQSGAAANHSSVAESPRGAGSGPEKVRLTESGEHIVSNVHAPSITAYIPPPEKATGAAVIVIPGGGHVELWMDHEGYNVAQFLKDHGIAAFVLKYRLAREKGSSYSIEGDSLPDVQRAIRMVRSDSARWHLDPSASVSWDSPRAESWPRLQPCATTTVRLRLRMGWIGRVPGQAFRRCFIRPFQQDCFRARRRPPFLCAATAIRLIRKGSPN